jgi:hypothetical protein
MKRILFLTATIAICLLTPTTYAQSSNLRIRYHVPFPFTVHNTRFAAGEYEVTKQARFLLMLRNLENQSSAFEPVKPAQSRKEGDGRVRLVFHRYGNEYFLAVVSAGSWESTYDFQISKEEKLLADASPIKQQKVASVLPNGNVQTADVDQE